MTLRLRLVLGYAYLVSLVLVTAVSAVAGFVVLSRGIDQVLADNVRSIEASMAMLESLERQDSATLSSLLASDEAADLEIADQAFRQALDDARGNITEDRERIVLGEMRRLHEELVAIRDQVIAGTPARPLVAYDEQIYPKFQAVKASVRELLDINHEAMQRADQEARTSARRSGAWIALLVTLAVVSLVLLSRALQQKVLERLSAVREVSKALAAGDTKRRVVLTGDDELTEIGCRLNEILDRRDENQGHWEGRLVVEKRLALALFQRLDPGGTIFALDGTPLIDGEHDDARADKVSDWIHTHGSDAVESLAEVQSDTKLVQEIDINGRTERLELLRTGPARPVGWWWRSA